MEDGTIFFMSDLDYTSGGDLYALNKKGDKVKIASDVLGFYAKTAPFSSYWLS